MRVKHVISCVLVDANKIEGPFDHSDFLRAEFRKPLSHYFPHVLGVFPVDQGIKKPVKVHPAFIGTT